jgi:Holliday junction resolvase RusA-like endonuclease
MTDPVTVVLCGEPVAWARTRLGKQGVFITPKKQRNNAAMLRALAAQEMAGRSPFDCAVRVDLRAEFKIPKGWSKAKKERALARYIRPTGKPDLSNIAKQVEDALNGIVYRDDALIVEYGTLQKVYSMQPKIVFTVSPIAVEASAP